MKQILFTTLLLLLVSSCASLNKLKPKPRVTPTGIKVTHKNENKFSIIKAEPESFQCLKLGKNFNSVVGTKVYDTVNKCRTSKEYNTFRLKHGLYKVRLVTYQSYQVANGIEFSVTCSPNSHVGTDGYIKDLKPTKFLNWETCSKSKIFKKYSKRISKYKHKFTPSLTHLENTPVCRTIFNTSVTGNHTKLWHSKFYSTEAKCKKSKAFDKLVINHGAFRAISLYNNPDEKYYFFCGAVKAHYKILDLSNRKYSTFKQCAQSKEGKRIGRIHKKLVKAHKARLLKEQREELADLQDELNSHVTRFEKEMGMKVPYTVKIVVKLSGPYKPDVVGRCLKYKSGKRKVQILKSWWDENTQYEIRENLVYHELGHCSFNRDHDDKIMTTYRVFYGCPASLMKSSVFSDADMVCYDKLRKQYVQGLKYGFSLGQ